MDIDSQSDDTDDNNNNTDDTGNSSACSLQKPGKRKQNYKSKYNSDWEKYFAWLSKTTSSASARCTLCNKNFLINNRGLHQVKQHEGTKQHKKLLSAQNHNNLIKAFCVSTSEHSSEAEKVTAVELGQVYNNVRHNLSYNSLDCGVKLNREMHKDYPLLRKVTLGRTKAEALVTNVLCQEAVHLVLSELNENVNFGLQIDASNVNNRKFFPIGIQYFDPKEGIKNKLLDFIENPDETSLGMIRIVEKTLAELKLDFANVSCLSADNCSANFGSRQSLFTEILLKNDAIKKSNCHAHILHNAVKHSVDVLEYDVESLVLKLYAHFSQSAKRRELLCDFAVFVEVEYRDLLHYVITRWLSLNPCIERILKMWKSLLSYFRSSRDCPQQIRKLLKIKDDEYEDTPENEIPEIYLLFCNSFLGLFETAILKLESNSGCITEVYDSFHNLLEKLEERLNKKFFGFIVSQKLKQLDPHQKDKMERNFILVLKTAANYNKKWLSFETINNWLYSISCFNFKNELKNEDICNVVSLLPSALKNKMDMDALFDETTNVQRIFSTCKTNEEFLKMKPADKWCHIFSRNQCQSLTNMERLISFIFSMPPSTAFVERIFSIMGNKWTDVRNKASVKLIRSELLITINFNLTCKDFYDKISVDKKLLRLAAATAKQ